MEGGSGFWGGVVGWWEIVMGLFEKVGKIKFNK